MQQKIILLFVLFCLFNHQSFSQEDKLNKAIELRVNNPFAALSLMDSVIRHPVTKNDFTTWTARAYIYYELYKKTDKVKLYSALRDSILSSIRISNLLKPDSEGTENNKRMLKALATGYRKVVKNQLEDSTNFEKSLTAFNLYKELTLKYSPDHSFIADEAEFYVARASVSLNYFNAKWIKNNAIDTNEYIFINEEINKLKKIAEKNQKITKKSFQ